MNQKPADDKEFEKQRDDLIMRLKDCLSHEDNPSIPFGDRCITKMQFKQQMKELYNAHYQKKYLGLLLEIIGEDEVWENKDSFIKKQDKYIRNNFRHKLRKAIANMGGDLG